MALPQDPFTYAADEAALEEAILEVMASARSLSREDAERLAKAYGCSARTIYRRAERAIRRVGDAAEQVIAMANVTETAPKAAVDGDTAGGGAADGGAAGSASTAGKPEGEPPASNFLDRMATEGQAGFVMDSLFLDIYFLYCGNMRRTRDEIERLGFEMPSLATLSRRKQELGPLVQHGARKGLKDLSKHVLYIRHASNAPNDLWQVDEITLDIFVRAPKTIAKKARKTKGMATDLEKENGQDAKETAQPVDYVRPRLVLFIDDHSRFITGWGLLSGAVTSDDFLCILAAGCEQRLTDAGNGVVIGGPPDALAFDNAQAFRSFLVADCLTGFPIDAKPCPAYTPTAKGKVERVCQTIQAMVITAMPGICSNAAAIDESDLQGIDPAYFMEFDEFTRYVAEAIATYNYELVHSATRKRPIELYESSGLGARAVDIGELAAMWLPVSRDNGRRSVLPSGVQVKIDGKAVFFQAPELSGHVGKKVQVRMLHHDKTRAAVFMWDEHADDLGPFIAIAKDPATLSEEERRAIVGTRYEQISEVTAHHRASRRALETEGVAIALGATADPVTALLASQGIAVPARDATTTDGPAAGSDGGAPADGGTADAAPADGRTADGGTAGREPVVEARQSGRRPATRRMARATAKAAPVPPRTRSGRSVAKRAVDMASAALEAEDRSLAAEEAQERPEEPLAAENARQGGPGAEKPASGRGRTTKRAADAAPKEPKPRARRRPGPPDGGTPGSGMPNEGPSDEGPSGGDPA
jgi:hypothetical protein